MMQNTKRYGGFNSFSSRPPYKGVSPRVTGRDYTSHTGQYVSIILNLEQLGDCTCGVTKVKVAINGVPDGAEVSTVSEFICYVDPSTNQLQYVQHTQLDDHFDFDVYRRLLDFIPSYPELF